MKSKLFTREEAVAEIRKRQGKMTLRDFAKLLGVSAPLIGDIYRGKILPSRKLGFEKVKESIRYRRVQNGANKIV